MKGRKQMPWTDKHLKWLHNTGTQLITADGKPVEVWELRHNDDDIITSAWAKHFRNHYCLDSEIDDLRSDTGLSRADYLSELIFPDSSKAPGPSIRAGDFAEILVADFLEFLHKYWVPRFRYDEKAVRNESTKGTDIIGFKFTSQHESPDDTLASFEVKAKLTGGSDGNGLQDAVNDSAKDFHVRKAETLNAMKRRLIRAGKRDDAKKIQRFQNKADYPYHEISGAAALFSTSAFDERLLATTDSSKHPNNGNLILVVIKGNELMSLVHELYKRGAHEA